jgi:hypothetical protein
MGGSTYNKIVYFLYRFLLPSYRRLPSLARSLLSNSLFQINSKPRHGLTKWYESHRFLRPPHRRLGPPSLPFTSTSSRGTLQIPNHQLRCRRHVAPIKVRLPHKPRRANNPLRIINRRRARRVARAATSRSRCALHRALPTEAPSGDDNDSGRDA